jgi:hypothetical protein
MFPFPRLRGKVPEGRMGETLAKPSEFGYLTGM